MKKKKINNEQLLAPESNTGKVPQCHLCCAYIENTQDLSGLQVKAKLKLLFDNHLKDKINKMIVFKWN